MERYICNSCNSVFSHPVRKVDRGNGEPYTECPFCGAEDYFDDVIRCEYCNKAISQSKAEHGLCAECRQETLKRFYGAFNEVEQSVIADALEISA